MEKIDIQTTQNVTIEYELATLRDRIIAMLLDSMIIGFVYFLLIILIVSSSVYSESNFGLAIVMGLGPIVFFIFYHLISEIATSGQSVGKRVVGIKVAKIDGSEAGLSDYLLRAVFHIVDTLFSGGILAALLISSTQKKQRLGDMTSNCTLIRLKSSKQFTLDSILKINTIEDYKPIYQDIRHFHEEDIILIKTILYRYQNHPNEAHQAALSEATSRFASLLKLEKIPSNKVAFLENLVKDYVVLTR